MKSYSELLIKTCHKRRAHAIGGMAAQIPIKGNEEQNKKSIQKNEYINTKKDNIKWNNYTWGKDEALFWNITPIGVVLHDDIAVVHYYYTTISKNKKNGKKTTEKGKWTDVIINDGGKWKLVADHGGKIESNTEE